MVNSFVEVIDKLGGATAFARAVGMEPNTARQARKRNSLSPKHFPVIAKLAEERGVEGVTVERLVELTVERARAA